MERKILKTENGIQELEIIIEDEKFQEFYNIAYNKIKNEINLPGFRKGKVPFHIVKKQFGGLLREHAIEEAAQSSFETAVEEDKIHLISRPELLNIDMNNGVVKFHFSYGVYPEVILNEYKGLTIDEPVHTVTEEEIEVRIQEILKSEGVFEESEIVEDEDYVVGLTFHTLDNETKEPIADIEPFEDNLYLGNPRADRNLVDIIIGRKKGESFEYVVEHDQPHDEHQHEPGETHQHYYNLELRDVQKLVPAELTDEFVKNYTKEKFDNIDDFKEDVEFGLQEEWDKKCRAAVEDQIVAKLIENNDIATPEQFVQNAINIMSENFKKQYGKAADKIDMNLFKDEFRPMAIRNVQWELIRNRIIEQENIELEDYDIDSIVDTEAQRLNKDREDVKKMILQNENFKMQILNKKVIDFVLDFAVTNEVPYEDYSQDEL